jgi:heat shock protein HslJ
VAEPVRFSDTMLVDARVVVGVYPQPHMKGAAGTMLCLYNRRTGHAEAVEATSLAAAPAAGSPAVKAVKDVWWRAEDIGGAGVVDNSNSTLMFGSDGKVAGKSGCNNYSANYQLSGAKLRVFPPMIGTRMMCPPAIMTQEARFQKILSEAEQATVGADGALVVTAKDKKSIRFLREAK